MSRKTDLDKPRVKIENRSFKTVLNDVNRFPERCIRFSTGQQQASVRSLVVFQ